MVCHKPRALFIAIPRTGTRSMYRYLQEHQGGELVRDHEIGVPAEYVDYYRFAVVRNPYDRAISMWLYLHQPEVTGLGFAEWVARITAPNYTPYDRNTPWAEWGWKQSYFLKGQRFEQVLRFEDLQVGLMALPFTSVGDSLPHENRVVGRGRWQHYMGPAEVKLVNEVWDEDFEHAGYTKISPETVETPVES